MHWFLDCTLLEEATLSLPLTWRSTDQVYMPGQLKKTSLQIDKMLCGDGLILWEWSMNSLSLLPSQWIWNLCNKVEQRIKRLIKIKAGSLLFCFAFFQSTFSPVCAGCFPLVVFLLKNRTFCKILWHAFDIQLARRWKIWAHAICCNFNHMTNCIN